MVSDVKFDMKVIFLLFILPFAFSTLLVGEFPGFVSNSKPAFPLNDGVIHLTDRTFDDALREYDHILVKFYAEWCPHCRIMAEDYSELAQSEEIRKILPTLPENSTTSNIKEIIIKKIDEFIDTRINVKNYISSKVGEGLVQEGDIILIYGKSIIFREILKKAKNDGISFKVIFVDDKKNNQLKTEIGYLANLGVEVIYSFLGGVNTVITKATKVWIKAKSIFSNVYSPSTMKIGDESKDDNIYPWE